MIWIVIIVVVYLVWRYYQKATQTPWNLSRGRCFFTDSIIDKIHTNDTSGIPYLAMLPIITYNPHEIRFPFLSKEFEHKVQVSLSNSTTIAIFASAYYVHLSYILNQMPYTNPAFKEYLHKSLIYFKIDFNRYFACDFEELLSEADLKIIQNFSIPISQRISLLISNKVIAPLCLMYNTPYVIPLYETISISLKSWEKLWITGWTHEFVQNLNK